MTDHSNKSIKEIANIPPNQNLSPTKSRESQPSDQKIQKPIILIADSEVPNTTYNTATTTNPSNLKINKAGIRHYNTTIPSTSRLPQGSIPASQSDPQDNQANFEPQNPYFRSSADSIIEKRLNHTVDVINEGDLPSLSPKKRKSRKYKSHSKMRDSSKSRDSSNSERSNSESYNKIKNDHSTLKNPNFDFSIHLPTIPQEVREFSPSKNNSITPWDKKTKREYSRLRFKEKSKNDRFQVIASNLDAIYAPRQNPRPLSKDLIKLITREEKKKNRSTSANFRDSLYKESYAGLAEAYMRNNSMTLEEKITALNNSAMISPANSTMNAKDIEQYIRMTRERYRSAPFDDEKDSKPDPKKFLRKGKIGKTPHLIKKTTEYKTPEREEPEEKSPFDIFSSNLASEEMSPIKKSPSNTSPNSPIITDKESIEYRHRNVREDYRKVQHIPTQFLLQQEENKKKEKEMKLRVGNRQNRRNQKVIEPPQPPKILPRSDDIFYQASNKTRGLKAELKLNEGTAIKFGTSPRTDIFKEKSDQAGIFNPVVVSSLSNRSARIVAPTFLKSRQFNEVRPAPGQYNIIRDFDVPPGHYGFAAKVILDEKNKTQETFGSKLFSYSVMRGNSKLGFFSEAKKGDMYNLREAQDTPGPGSYDVYMYPKTRGCSFSTGKRIDLQELPTIEETNKFYVDA